MTASGLRESDAGLGNPESLERTVRAWLARPSSPRLVLALALLAAGLFLFLDGHDQTFWYDEWAFVLERRGSDLGTFLEPHNGHLSLLPILAYKGLLSVAGMDHYWPFRLVVVALHLTCVVLIYLYAERRVGGWLAFAAALLILFLGPGWEVIIWPFEMAWVASLAAGLGALLLLDRRDRRGNVGAAVLLTLSVVSSGLGVAILIGALAETLLRKPRRPWVVAAPLVVYAGWYLAYSESNFALNRLAKVPTYVADSLAGALGSLVGLTGGGTFPNRGEVLDWGRPLAVVAVAVIAWRLVKLGRVPPRVATLGATVLGFWVLTAISRAGVSVGGYSLAPPYASRYLYVGGFFLVLLAVELLRGVTLTPVAWLLLGVALLAGVVSHMGVFRDASRYLRNNATILTTNLGALELAKGRAGPDHEVGPYLRAGPYFEASRDWGTPARSPDEILSGPEERRAGADFVLSQIYGVATPRAAQGRPGGAPPTVEASGAGSVTTAGSCVTLRPRGYNAPWVRPELQLEVPRSGLLLRAEDGQPVELTARRFATRYPRQPLGVLQGGTSTVLRIPTDAAPQPWHVQLMSAGRVTACGLA